MNRKARRDIARASGKLPPIRPIEVQPVVEVEQTIREPYVQQDMFKLSFYLERNSNKKHNKKHLRQDKQSFLAANKYKIRNAKEKAAKEAEALKFKKKSHEIEPHHHDELGHSHAH